MIEWPEGAMQGFAPMLVSASISAPEDLISKTIGGLG